MNPTRNSLLVACILIGAAVTAGPVAAASNNANPASTGYPNGRPWLAIKSDFTVIKRMLRDIDYTLDGLVSDVDLIHEDVSLMKEDVDAIAEDLDGLSNTLQVQVSVMDDAARNADNDAPVTVFVHVTHNGQAVTGLTADDFSYTNAFPVAGADYCGVGCFTAGDAGVYAITLNGDWSVTSYAGSLTVSHTQSTPEGDVTSNGSSMVNFDIPAAPPVL